MTYTREKADEMRLRIDYNNMMKKYVGEYGISDAELSALSGKAAKAHKAMEEKRVNGKMDWRNLPYNQEEIVKEIKDYAEQMKDKVEAFVVLGIGGSALGHQPSVL